MGRKKTITRSNSSVCSPGTEVTKDDLLLATKTGHKSKQTVLTPVRKVVNSRRKIITNQCGDDNNNALVVPEPKKAKLTGTTFQSPTSIGKVMKSNETHPNKDVSVHHLHNFLDDGIQVMVDDSEFPNPDELEVEEDADLEDLDEIEMFQESNDTTEQNLPVETVTTPIEQFVSNQVPSPGSEVTSKLLNKPEQLYNMIPGLSQMVPAIGFK